MPRSPPPAVAQLRLVRHNANAKSRITMSVHIRLLKAFIRVLSIPYFISAVFPLVSVPERIMLAIASQPAFRSSAITGLVSLGVQVLLDIIAGTCLWYFAGPIARRIGKDLLEDV